MEHKVLSDLVQKCICCKQFTILGHPGSLTKLVEMLVRRWSGTHHSRTGRCPATNCCLGDCWTLFSPYNTKCLKIILYSTQKALSGPLLRVAHYLTWYSKEMGKKVCFHYNKEHGCICFFILTTNLAKNGYFCENKKHLYSHFSGKTRSFT